MLTLKLNPVKANLITHFMKSYLALTAAEKVVYDRDVQTIEEPEREVCYGIH